MSSTGEHSDEAKAQAGNDSRDDEYRRWVEATPPAVEPFYPFRAPNESIPLYAGQLRGTAKAGEVVVDGAIETAFQPTLRLRYKSTEELPPRLALEFFAADVDFDLFPADVSRLPVPPQPIDENRTPPVEGYLLQLEMGAADRLAFMTFQLPNFLPFIGDWIRHEGHLTRGRLVLSGGGWRITIDSREGLDDIVASVKRSGGYALTHVGRLEREDGALFELSHGQLMIDAIYRFCSFVNGFATGPLLPVGFVGAGQAVWSDWRPIVADPWHSVDSWADALHPNELTNLFPRFLNRWLDPYWQRVVNAGIAFYLDANVPRTLQRAIVLAQIGLELLVYAVLVDEQHVGAQDIKPIGVGIARLLDHYKISTVIPKHFTELADLASSNGWATGPWAVTALRNEFVHAKRATPVRPYKVWLQAWKLISWYLELALLATFGFNGEYMNRLNWPRRPGTVEPVPWAVAGARPPA